FEIGADFGLRQNRVSIEATYYNKLVKDRLLFRPLATSTGYTQRFENIGEMSNKGFELLARSINLETPRVRWATTVTYSHNRNRIERLNVDPFTLGYANRVAVGQPVGFFCGRYYVRDANGAIALDSLGRPKGSVGSKNIGDPNPDWMASLLNEVQLGRSLRLRVLFDGTVGNDVLNFSRRILDIFATGRDAERELLPFGDPNKLPAGYLFARRNRPHPPHLDVRRAAHLLASGGAHAHTTASLARRDDAGDRLQSRPHQPQRAHRAGHPDDARGDRGPRRRPPGPVRRRHGRLRLSRRPRHRRAGGDARRPAFLQGRRSRQRHDQHVRRRGNAVAVALPHHQDRRRPPQQRAQRHPRRLNALRYPHDQLPVQGDVAGRAAAALPADPDHHLPRDRADLRRQGYRARDGASAARFGAHPIQGG